MPYAIFVSKRGKPKAAGLPRIWLNGKEVGKTEVAVRNDIERCERMMEKCWLTIPNRYRNVILHEDIVIPNHFHTVTQNIKINNK